MKPASLPLGNAFTEFVMDNTILYKEKILEIWNDINEVEKKLLITTKFPRLELILSSVITTERLYLKDERKGAFLHGMKMFEESPYNENHKLIACLVRAGAQVMTANFDLGIEQAYRSCYSEDCEKKVVHFHGTFSSGKRIGVTIENITSFITSSVENKVRKCFSPNKINIFLGYSFSDMYDINMMIKNIYRDSTDGHTSQNIVCNHNGWDPYIQKKVFALFGKENVTVVDKDSTELLKELCEYYRVSVEKQKIERNNQEYDWKQSFKDKTVISEEFKLLSTLHLLNRMSVAPEKVDINLLDLYERLDWKIEKKEIMEYYLAINSPYWYEKYGVSRLTLDFYKRKVHERRFDSEYQKEILKMQKMNEKIDGVIVDIHRKNYIGHNQFAELSDWIRSVKSNYMMGEWSIDLTQIKELLIETAKLPVGKFPEIIEYASMLRYKMLILSENLSEAHEDYLFTNEIYYDIAYVDGIIAARLDFFLLLVKKQETTWKEVLNSKSWSELKYLVERTGTYRYKYAMEQVEKMYSISE